MAFTSAKQILMLCYRDLQKKIWIKKVLIFKIDTGILNYRAISQIVQRCFAESTVAVKCRAFHILPFATFRLSCSLCWHTFKLTQINLYKYLYPLHFRPWDKDRVMNTDIDAATDLLAEQRVWKVVKPFIEKYNSEKSFDMRPPSPTATVLGKMSRLEKQLQSVQIQKVRQQQQKQHDYSHEHFDEDEHLDH